MEHPDGVVAAGRVPLAPTVDSGGPERYGVGVGSRAADEADGCPRDVPSRAGQTARRDSALCSAVGARLSSRQARVAAATARDALAGLPSAGPLGNLAA